MNTQNSAEVCIQNLILIIIILKKLIRLSKEIISKTMLQKWLNYKSKCVATECIKLRLNH